MTKCILDIADYDDPSHPTGLWPSERIHGTLVTGENPGSAKETARKVAAPL